MDITSYIVEYQPNDNLLMGFPSDKQNPYREKSPCQNKRHFTITIFSNGSF